MISRNVSLLKIAKSAKSLHPSVERPEYKSYVFSPSGCDTRNIFCLLYQQSLKKTVSQPTCINLGWVRWKNIILLKLILPGKNQFLQYHNQRWYFQNYAKINAVDLIKNSFSCHTFIVIFVSGDKYTHTKTSRKICWFFNCCAPGTNFVLSASVPDTKYKFQGYFTPNSVNKGEIQLSKIICF